MASVNYPAIFQPFFRMLSGSAVNKALYDTANSSQDGLTALSGGGQSGSPVLLAVYTQVGVVAAANDSVQLPVAIQGKERTVKNNGASNLAIYANSTGSDTINGVVGTTQVTLLPGNTATFRCVAVGKWIAGGVTTQATSQTLTPQLVVAAGSNSQANSALITNALVMAITVSVSTRGVRLPVATTGAMVFINNPAAVNLNVYPATNGKIQAAATNAVSVLTAGKGTIYMARNTTQWYIIKGA